MEFKINVTKFLTALNPVVDVATRNTVKDFRGAFMVSVNSANDELEMVSHGGNACIKTKLMNSKIDKLNYESIEEGSAVVEAKKLMMTLTSFPPNKDVVIKTNLSTAGDDSNGELEVICDDTEIQSMPISKNIVNAPVMAKTFSITLEANRETFIAGMQKVNFAVGIEEYRPKYLCQILDASKEALKFISGNGARFAINEITGKGIVKTDKKYRVVFPKGNISNILTSLKSSSAEAITIKEGLATTENSDQVIVEFDETVLIILGIDTKIKNKFPDLDKVLGYDHPYQLKVAAKDWIYPTKGTRATYSDEMKTDSLVHNAELEADVKKSKFIVKSETNMKSKRTVPFEAVCVGDEKKVTLRLNSLYLAEMVSQGYDSGNVLMRFIDQDKPIVVDYPEIKDGIKDTTEKYSIFFTTSKKK